jgi:membrane-bound acyltransferase YfiQ involved in biofilm formation
VLRSRLVGVALPYVIWSAVFLTIDAAMGVWHPPLTYLRKIILGDAISGFYYVPLLCQFYLISPVLVRWARSHPKRLLAITGAWQLLMVGLPYLWGLWGDAVEAQRALRAWDWTFPRWTFYFALGIVGGFAGKRFTAWLTRYRRQLLAAAIALGVLAVAESQFLFRATGEWDWAYAPLKLSSALYAPTTVLAFLSFSVRPSSTSWRLLDHLGAFSFGIFLVHGKALELLARAIYHLAPTLLAHQVALAAVLFVVVLGGAWGALKILSRSPARHYYRYFFG